MLPIHYSMYRHELAACGNLLHPDIDRRMLADVSVRETLDYDVRRTLPVMDGQRFAGLPSKSNLFDPYRPELSVRTPR